MTTIIGRNDSMVKIRGYTVYLSAIEETLRNHCDAADAAVLAENEDEVNKRRGRSMGGAGRAETCVLSWNGICRSTWCPATSWNWRRSQ